MHPFQAERDGLRMLAFDESEPVGKLGFDLADAR
jgi:hypothetical protein